MTSLSIEFDVVAEDALAAIRVSALNLFERMCNKHDHARDLIWPSIDSDRNTGAPALMLVTLDRIGVEPGRSGASAFIAYFYVKTPDGARSSRPMVVKIGRSTPHDKLRDEYDQAEGLKQFITRRDPFALPVHFDPASSAGGIGVLWAPFTSGFNFWDSGSEKISFSHSDLLSLLRPARGAALDTVRHDRAYQVLDRIFQELRPIHAMRLSPTGVRQPASMERRSLVEEYSWYLRSNLPWRKHWEGVWSPAAIESVRDFGRSWVNPMWLLNALESVHADLCIGGIHGDLHPRNVVLDADGNPYIIDFGWAHTAGHVVKDFVLLECNLRFVVLAPELSFRSIRSLAGWLSQGDPLPVLESMYLEQRQELITRLRAIADLQCQIGDPQQWILGYGVPLFLTAIGLLAHARDFDNLVAARLTILELANRIAPAIKALA